jgi:hypothetical protein
MLQGGDGRLNPSKDSGNVTKSKVFAVMDILNSKLSQPEDSYAIKNQCKLNQSLSLTVDGET